MSWRGELRGGRDVRLAVLMLLPPPMYICCTYLLRYILPLIRATWLPPSYIPTILSLCAPFVFFAPLVHGMGRAE